MAPRYEPGGSAKGVRRANGIGSPASRGFHRTNAWIAPSILQPLHPEMSAHQDYGCRAVRSEITRFRRETAPRGSDRLLLSIRDDYGNLLVLRSGRPE